MILAYIFLQVLTPELANNIFVQYGFMGVTMFIMFYYAYHSFKQDKEERKEMRADIKSNAGKLDKIQTEYLNYVKSSNEKTIKVIENFTLGFKDLKNEIKECRKKP